MQFSDTQIISLIVAVVPFLVSLAVFLGKLLISKLPANKQPEVMKLIQLGVNASEQMGSGMAGSAKKKMAVDFINSSLKSFGLNVNPNFVDVAIEALVLELNNRQTALPASVPTSPVVSVLPVDGSAHNG